MQSDSLIVRAAGRYARRALRVATVAAIALAVCAMLGGTAKAQTPVEYEFPADMLTAFDADNIAGIGIAAVGQWTTLLGPVLLVGLFVALVCGAVYGVMRIFGGRHAKYGT